MYKELNLILIARFGWAGVNVFFYNSWKVDALFLTRIPMKYVYVHFQEAAP